MKTATDVSDNGAGANAPIPDDYEFPTVPLEVCDELADHLFELIKAHLPPVWWRAIEIWGILYARHNVGPDDLAEYIGGPYNALRDYLAGRRRTPEGRTYRWGPSMPKYADQAVNPYRVLDNWHLLDQATQLAIVGLVEAKAGAEGNAHAA